MPERRYPAANLYIHFQARRLIASLALLLCCSCLGRSDTGDNPATGARIQTSPASVAADGVSQSVIDIYVLDGAGTPLPGVATTLTATGPLTIIQPTGLTDAAGHAVAYASGRTPGRYELTLATTLAGKALHNNARLPLTLLPVAASLGNRLELAITPATASVDVATVRQVRAALLSADGTPIAHAPVSIASSRAVDRLSPPSGTTSADGIFSATLSSTTAGAAMIAASSPAGSSAQGVASFLAGAPSAAHTYFLTQMGNEVAADGVTTTAAEVFVGDQYGNPVSFAPVAVSSPAPSVTLVPPAGTADGQGIFRTTLSASQLGNTSILVDTGAGVSPHPVQLVVGPASPATSAIIVQPNEVVANAQNIATATITLRDAAGHPRSGDAITWSSSSANDIITAASVGTDAFGAAQANVSSTAAGNVTLSAQGNALTLRAPLTWLAGPPVSGQSSMTASPATWAASHNLGVTLSVVLRDAFGNRAAAIPITFSASDASVVWGSQTAMTDASGQASIQLGATHSANVLLYADFVGGRLSTPLVVLPSAVSAAQSTLGATPQNVVADGSSTTAISVALRDAYGNAVGAEPVSLASSDASDSFVPSSGVTASDGTFVSQLSSTRAETKSVVASFAAQSLSVNVTFVPGPTAKTFSSLVLSPNLVVADGNATIGITLYVADAYNNPIANQTVSLAASGTQDTLVPTMGTTSPNGIFNSSWSSTAAATQAVTATFGSVLLQANALFVAGPPAPATSSLSGAPNTVVADGQQLGHLAALLRDAFGNPAANQPIAWTTSGAQITLSSNTSVTDSNGQAAITCSSSLAQQLTTYAQTGNLTLSAGVTFVAGSPNSAQSTLTLNSNVAVAGQSFIATILLKDAFSNPAANQLVTIGGGNNLATINSFGATDANGAAIATLSSTLAQNLVLVAQSGPATLSAPLRIVPASPNSAYSSVIVTPNSAVVSSAASPIAISGRVADVYNNPIAFQPISLSATVPRFVNVGYASLYAAGYDQIMLNNATLPAYAFYSQTPNFSVFGAGMPQYLQVLSGNNTLGIIDSSQPLYVDYLDISQGDTNNLFEAELAVLGGNATIATSRSGFSGSGYVVMSNSANGSISINVSAGAISGNTFIAYRYHCDEPWGTPAFASLSVNGNFVTNLAFNHANPTWPTSYLQAINLSPGNNLITLQGGNSLLLIDQVIITTRGPTQRIEAESGTRTGGVGVFGSPTASAMFFVRLDAAMSKITVPYFVSSETISPTQVVSDANGLFQSTWRSSTAETKGLVAVAANVSIATATAAFSPNAPSSSLSLLKLSSAANVATAGSALYASISLKDALNNPVAAMPVLWTSTQPNDAIVPLQAATTSLGLASAAVTTYQAGQRTLCAQASNMLAQCVNITTLASSPNASASSLYLSPNQTVAGASTTANIVLRDAYQNATPNQTIVFGGAGNLSIFAQSSVTDNFGSAGATLMSTLAQNTVLTATSGTATLSVPWRVSASSPNSSQSYFAANANLAIADNMSTYTLVGVVRDAFANPVPNISVTAALQENWFLAARYSAGSGTNANFTGVSVNGTSLPPWLVLGNANYTDYHLTDHYPMSVSSGNNLLSWSLLTLPSSQWDALYMYPTDNNWTIQAETGTLIGGAVVGTYWNNYTGSGFVDFHNIIGASLIVNTPGVAGDLNREFSMRYALLGSANAAYRIALNGNLLPVVYLPVTPDWNTWYMSPPIMVTLAPGNNTIQFFSANPTISIDFFRLRDVPRTTQVVQAESGTLFGGASFSNAYPSFQGTGCVSMNTTLGAGFTVGWQPNTSTLTPASSLSNSAGQVTVNLTSKLASTKSLTIGNANFSIATSVPFAAGAAQASNCTLAVGANPMTAGASTMVGVVARDIFDNPVANSLVSFTASTNSFVVSPNSVSTDQRGVASTYVTSTLSQAAQICATIASNVVLCQNVVVQAASPNASLSTLTVSPNVVIAGSTVSYQGTFVDSYGNICANQSLSLVNQGNASSSFGPFAINLDTNGALSFSTSTAVAANFVATIAPQAGNFAAAFVVNPNVAGRIIVQGLRTLPSGLINDVQITVRDAYNNVLQPQFTGTVGFSSSDTGAIVPLPYTFAPSDQSTRTLFGQTQLFTQGNQTLTAYLTGNPSTSGTMTAFVQPPVVAPFQAMIFNSSPNLCLQPTNLSSAANNTLVAAICAQTHYQASALGSDQSWRLLNQCLQPQGGVFAAAQNIVVVPCTSSLQQRWVRSGTMMVSVANPNYCADGTTALAGGPLALVSCGSPNASSIVLSEITRSRDISYNNGFFGPRLDPGAFLADTYPNSRTLLWFTGEDDVRVDANNCMYVTDPALSPNAQVQVGACTGGNAQKWVVDGVRLRSKYSANLCLTRNVWPAVVTNCATSVGSNANFNLVNSGYAVQFRPYSALANNTCLQTAQYPATDLSNVILAPCNQSYRQMFISSSEWSKTSAGFWFGNPGDFNFPFLSYGVGGGNKIGLPVNLRLASNTNNVSQSYVFFRLSSATMIGSTFTTNAGPQLTMDANTTLYGNVVSLGNYGPGPSRQFILEPRPAMVSSPNNLCLSAQSGNNFYNQSVMWMPCAQAANQKMFFPYATGNAPSPTTAMPIAFNGLCLDAQSPIGSGSTLLMTTCNYASSQYWKVGPGPLALVNGSGLCLDANSAQFGNVAQLQNCTGASNQNVGVTFF